jgi:hypothetical protein
MAHRGGDVRQSFDCLHHRSVVRGMHDGRCGEGNEVQQVERRPLAIEFGEMREHAASEPDAWER